MNTVRFTLSAAGLCFAMVYPSTAMAQSSNVAMSMAAQITTEHPVKVSTCNPERNVNYGWAGYTPGFYGPGVYGGYWGWPSVYGPTYYQPPVENDPTLGIDYVNVTQQVMKEIEFGLIVRGALVAEVKDVGTFSRVPRSSTNSV